MARGGYASPGKDRPLDSIRPGGKVGRIISQSANN